MNTYTQTTDQPKNDTSSREAEERVLELKQNISFGSELYRLRVERGLTQITAARLCNLTRGYYSQIENSKRFPPPSDTFDRFVRALRLSQAQAEELRVLAQLERDAQFKLPRELPREVAELVRALIHRAPKLNTKQLNTLRKLIKEDCEM